MLDVLNHFSETEKTGELEEDGRLGRMGSMRRIDARMGGWEDGRV